MGISDLYRAQIPVTPSTGTPSRDTAVPSGQKPPSGAKSEFHSLLSQEQLKLSQHAETRIKSREIAWDATLQKRILEGLNSAESKGSREALIIAGDVAVIANVKSRTIITAMDRNELKDRIFTNIDSAVLV